MIINKSTNEQLELTIAPEPCAPRRQRRVTTARLWFARMRQIVDSAHDWPPRPIQPPLLPARTITVAAAPAEQQLAE